MNNIMILDKDIHNIQNMERFFLKSCKQIDNIYFIVDESQDVVSELIKKNITIVFFDIRFFGVYSMKIVEEIASKIDKIQIIYYGMMSDTTYINKCMEVKGLTFLYRPLRPADMINAIEDGLKFIKTEQVKKNQHDELILKCINDRNLFKSIFLNSLIVGHINDSHEIERSFRHYDISITPNFRVISFRIDRYRNYILTLEEDEKQLMVYKIVNVIEENLQAWKNVVFVKDFNNAIAVISDFSDQDDLIVLCEKIKLEIYNILSVRISCGIGREYSSYKDIQVSFSEADGALRYRYYLGYYTVIPIDFVEPRNHITYRYPIEQEQKLIYSAVIGEYEYCKTLLGQLVDALKISGELPTSILPKIIMLIIISISKYATEQNKDLDYNINSFYDFSEIIKIDDLEQLQLYLDKFLVKFCEHVNKIVNDTNVSVYNKAKEYIEKNYFENINAVLLSKKLETSPEFLSKVFGEYAGMNIREYLINTRIVEAKRIMRETNNNDEAIAVFIGFTNERYLRSIFEQKEKMSTLEYRRKYGVFFQNKSR